MQISATFYPDILSGVILKNSLINFLMHKRILGVPISPEDNAQTRYNRFADTVSSPHVVCALPLKGSVT
jgi:hypothetical protein